ncbi:MAG: hypothetical protein J0M37_11365 [Ignavibacteria bacterium]|nr:hypothetical protein [Ignavibacteria bacterium]
MELGSLDQSIWYNYNSEKDNLENAFSFLEELPEKLNFIFSQESFKRLFDDITEDINYELFENSFYEVREQLDMNLKLVKENIRIKRYKTYLYLRLAQNGFTENSFKLKINLLNFHWKKAYLTAKNGIIDFANNKTVGLMRKVLDLLNSILGSFASIIPGVDAVKEIKEVAESIISLGEK